MKKLIMSNEIASQLIENTAKNIKVANQYHNVDVINTIN